MLLMQTWIFQANPDRFDIDQFLDEGPDETTWLVTRQGQQMQIGDQVFIWRSAGKGRADSGVIAECRMIETPRDQTDDPSERRFWADPSEADTERLRVRLRIRIAFAEDRSRALRYNGAESAGRAWLGTGEGHHRGPPGQAPGAIERAAQEAAVWRVGGVTTMTKSQIDYDLKAGVKLLEKMGYGDLQITKDLRAVSEGKPPAGLPVKPLNPRPRVKGARGGLRFWKKRGKK